MKGCPEKLRNARVRAEVSQESLAAGITGRLNPRNPIHVTTISRIENGHLPLRDLPFVVAWARECGVEDFRELLEEPEVEDDEATVAPLLRDMQDQLMSTLRPSKEGVKK